MFDAIDLVVNYRLGARRYSVSLKDGGNEDIGFAVSKYQDRLTIELLTENKCVIESAVLKTAYYYVPHYRVYCGAKYAGFSEETSVSPSSKKRLLKLINSRSVVKFPLKRLTSWSYTYIRDRDKYTLVGSMEETSTFTMIQHRPELRSMIFKREYHGGMLLPQEYTIFDLFFMEGGYDEVFDEYFKRLCPNYTPKKLLKEYDACSFPHMPLTEDIFRKKLVDAMDFPTQFDTFVLENYYKEPGDWLNLDPTRFTSSLREIAKEIRTAGLEAGIKISPFEVVPNTLASTNLKKLLEKDDMNITILKKGVFHLDVNNVEVRTYLTELFTTLKDMGFTVFKISGIMSTIYGKQEARKAREIMQLLRDTMGKDVTFIVTDAPIISAAGIADYCRVSGQKINRWKGSLFSRIFKLHNSARGTVRSMIARRHLDGRVFRNYPVKTYYDPKGSWLTEEQKSILIIVSRFFSGAVLVNDDLSIYTEELKGVFATLSDENKMKINRVNVPRTNYVEIDYEKDGKEKLFCFNLKHGRIHYEI